MSRIGDSTRDRIIRAAEPLFAEHGFSGVSMRSIAIAAGVKLGGLPYHFGTKEALYRVIWAHWMSQIDVRILLLDAQAEAGDTLPSKLRALVQAFFAGPRKLLHDERGRYFVSIMVREALDPTRFERTVLEDFIFPNRDALRAELELLFADMPAEARDLAHDMMVAALRIVIEQGPANQDAALRPAAADRAFDMLTEFVVQGWLALYQQK